MRSFISTIFLLATIVPFTLADYSITSPATGDTWNKDETVLIKWTVTSESDNTVDVSLLSGLASNLQLVQKLCSGVNPNVGQCSFVVPGNLPSGRDYAVTVGNSANPSHIVYSSFFSILSSGNLPSQKGCPNFGGQNCPQSLPCCSFAGYCGDTAAHCGSGCKPEFSFNGVCVQSGSTQVKATTTKKSSTKKSSTKKSSTKKSSTKKSSTKKSSTKKSSTKKSTKKLTTKKHPKKKTSSKKKSSMYHLHKKESQYDQYC